MLENVTYDSSWWAAAHRAPRRRMMPRRPATMWRCSTGQGASSPAAAPFRRAACAISTFPPELLVARVFSARIISPSDRKVDMPIPNSYVGMVDREHFDEWLRERAAEAGAERRTGTYEGFTRDGYGTAIVQLHATRTAHPASLRARCVIGADGALSKVARDTVRGLGEDALCLRLSRDHQVARERQRPNSAPTAATSITSGTLSPDFYAWVFPHGDTTSVGTGSANKGFSLKGSVAELRKASGPRRRDHPPRGRAHSAEAPEALGQRPRRGAGGRCRGRRGAGLGRGHLLRHAGRQAGGRCRHGLPAHGRCARSCHARASAS